MAAYTRRAFAGFCGAAAVFAAFGGAVKAADGASETALVRPPGAQDELHLLASRRGIVVVSPSAYARLGKTVVEDESEMSA